MNRLVFLMSVATVAVVAAMVGCAGERQGLVCDEMEYRLNTMTYSPDQRAYAEEELRVCREQEAEKKAAGAASRQSIYDRFAASDSTKEKSAAAGNAAAGNSNGEASESSDGANGAISVSEALKDSSGEKTVSIYDRYKSVEPSAENALAENSSAEKLRRTLPLPMSGTSSRAVE